jgi:spermidine synthase
VANLPRTHYSGTANVDDSGLGVGTSATALITHGINTTIVEIDPVVYEFAQQYFGLPPNHTAVLEDAVTFVAAAQRHGPRYNYIIHDVFTGGAEPAALFTVDFIAGLRDLLLPNGVIAIVSLRVLPYTSHLAV